MATIATPKSRTALMSLLTQACELEHGLACSYLYTAFSLKQQVSEGGLTTDQARKTKFWASQIFFVASQEMLHLAQAWNLLSAIGGTPYCLRPNLPQNSRYYPLHARIALEPFGEKSLKRFIVYETPARAATAWVRKQATLSKTETDRGHVTIGELYGAIADGFSSIPNLFVGNPANQADRQSVQFPDLVKVRDTASALQGIQMITDQGEGIVADRLDCHYGIFLGILKQLEEEQASAGAKFRPARPVMDNPVADTSHGYGAVAHPIKDALTRQTTELFDAIYLLMLQALAFAFMPAADPARSAKAAQAALELMTTVIRPVGDALTRLPSGVRGLNAGPAFGLTRFVALPDDPALVINLLRGRLGELGAKAERLAAALPSSPQLALAGSRLHDVAARCAN
jgi:hypothetical protein